MSTTDMINHQWDEGPDEEIDRLQAERDERGVIVELLYELKEVAPGFWLVTHPDDADRNYVVNTADNTCSCLDFDYISQKRRIDCKHLVAVKAKAGNSKQKRPDLDALIMNPSADGADPYRMD